MIKLNMLKKFNATLPHCTNTHLKNQGWQEKSGPVVTIVFFPVLTTNKTHDKNLTRKKCCFHPQKGLNYYYFSEETFYSFLIRMYTFVSSLVRDNVRIVL